MRTVNRRLVLATLAVTLLATTAGCTMLFGGISDETLDESQSYDDLRDREADVAIEVESGSFVSDGEFRAVYDLNDTEDLSLYRSTLYREEPLEVRAVRYWYPNGTELTGSELEVDQDRSSTDIRVPDGNGTLAFTGSASQGRFYLPAYVDGSYEVILPPGYRSTNYLFGSVNPGGHEREVVDDQEHLRWDHVDSSLSIRYYLGRDVFIFAGVVLVVVSVGGAGVAYYYRKVKALEEKRKSMGLDVELEDDSGKGPPPGM
ncbi:DUF5803 family protein [Natronosalvus halobius]|uniref:DUF5803 family protein n=1 Tax=Natronosalvus halobius TaxID=2953746 RepID=UPI00209EA906|nr:DUF5803 family protein [Natronosalvus halobius]USZ70334.1 DUF5803 family protein [Natronosalvus halobius]